MSFRKRRVERVARSASRLASEVDVTRKGSEGRAKIASSASSAPANASPAWTRPSANAVSMPAERIPVAASKLGLICSFPALNSLRRFAKVVMPSPGHRASRMLRRHIPNSLSTSRSNPVAAIFLKQRGLATQNGGNERFGRTNRLSDERVCRCRCITK